MKTSLLKLSGGFHDSGEIVFRVAADSAQEVVSGERELYDALSANQLKRADKHFCGISDCQCGGCHGKNIEKEIVD
jgi:hypothetical protein